MLAEDRPVGSVERLFHLRRGAVVGTLRPELLSVVAESARPRVFRKGQALLLEGERVGAAHFVIEGRVHLARSGVAIGHGGPGTAIGEIGMIARAPAALSATAENDVLTLELDAETCLDLCDDQPGILRHFLHEICGRIIDDWRRLPAGTPSLLGKPPGVARSAALRDLDLVERIFQLRSFSPFDRASINALAELARSLSEVHLEPGARLWSEGEAARHVVLVLAGEAEGRSRSGFRIQAVRGASLGALEAIAGRPRWYDAQVTTPLTALTGEIEVLFDVFEDNLELALSFLTAMSRWWLKLAEQLANGPDAATSLDVSRVGSASEPATEPAP